MTDAAASPAIDFIAKTVAENPVVVFMKGVPDQPRCGFSSVVVQILDHLGVEFVPFTTSEADVAAELWQRGMRSLSLADRACLATAIVRGLPVVTADKAWSRLSLEVPVKIIR